MSELDDLREALQPLSDVRLAVAFGSVARGRETPASDLDVGVLLGERAGPSLWDVEVAAARRVRRQVDLVDLRRAPPLLRFEIARDGLVLFEREAGLWTGFKARAMIDWWDWAPIARRFHKIAAARPSHELGHGQA